MDYIRALLTLIRHRAPRPPSLDESSLAELLVTDVPDDPVTGLPTRLLCPHCMRLTKFDTGGVCGVSATPACKEAWNASKKHIQPYFSPSFFHTAMAMYRHRRSPYALLASLTPATITQPSCNGITTQWIWRYSIVIGSLRLRTLVTHLLPRSYNDNYTFQWQPCPHTSSYQSYMDAGARSVQDTVRGKHRRDSGNFITCLYCRTVVIFGARKFRSRGIGLFVAWWKDLGDGRLGDERWADQVRATAMPGEWKQISYDVSDLCDGFDNNYAYYFDFDTLKSRAEQRELLRLNPIPVVS